MTITDTKDLMIQMTDKLTAFLLYDMQISKDFKEFSQIETKYLSPDEKRSRTLSYLYTRKISGKSVFDYYLSRAKYLAQKEIKIIEAFKNAFVGVFRVEKVLKEGFELYSIINEKNYTANAIGAMTVFRGVSQGAFLYCCLCKIDDEYYVYDVRAITSPDKIGGAQRYAITKIIENPDLVYYDNEEKLNEIKAQIDVFDKKFKECFHTNEVITTNKYADDIINAFNDYCENDSDEILKLVANGIKKPQKYEYFPTKDFNFSGDDFAKKSMAGFSAQGNEYDVGIVFIEKSGLYAIPFFGTFCKIFEVEDYKTVPNYDACVRNFIHNDKISNVIISLVANKYPDFQPRINEILGENFSFEELLKKFKSNHINKPAIATASILYSSKVFSEIMIREAKKEEEIDVVPVEKVGRNDPCPCGSGKKYKKCCMLKEALVED